MRRGLIVDLFAGGGGASAGIEAALGRSVDIAINHDALALAVHKARFWSRVQKAEGDGCWVYTGGRQKRRDGSRWYGVFCVGKARILAHVFSWTEEHGPVPDGLVLRHQCDNPPCVRPSHLLTGTQAENLADMRARGRAHFNRFPTGSAHPNAKLDAEKARLVRALRAEGLSLAKIGARVGLHASTVHDIVRGKTWAHL